MAKKAKDILLAAGYTEAQIADPAMATLLNNTQFCKALEAESIAAETAEAERVRLEGDLNADTEWYKTQAAPAIKTATERAITAEGRAANAEARLKAAQEMGLIKIGEQEGTPPANPANSATSAIDPNTGKYLTQDQVDKMLADRMGLVGDAVTMAADIPAEHYELFGARLPGGVSGLRKEFQAAQQNNRFRGSLMDFWEQKYKVADKRAEVATLAHQKELDAYAADKVKARETELISQYGNPMTRPLTTSRSPFTNRGSAITGQSGAKPGESGAPTERKQPWEGSSSPEQRSANRVTAFVKRQMEKTA